MTGEVCLVVWICGDIEHDEHVTSALNTFWRNISASELVSRDVGWSGEVSGVVAKVWEAKRISPLKTYDNYF